MSPNLLGIHSSFLLSPSHWRKTAIFKLTLLWMLWGCALELRAVPPHSDYRTHVLKNCYYSRYPDLCVQTLMDSQNPTDNILSTLVDRVLSETAKMPFNVKPNPELSSSATVHLHDKSIDAAQEYCTKAMERSLKRLNQTALSLEKSPGRFKQDIQTWLSAVLTYQQDCVDAVSSKTSHFPYDDLKANQITQKMSHLSRLTSNALALINRVPTNTTNSNTNQARFPSWLSAQDKHFLTGNNNEQPNANLVVAQDGSGNYKTIREAIEAAPSSHNQRFIIYIKAGTYREKISLEKDGITLIGDGKASTIITASSSAGDDGSRSETSATFSATGDSFIAQGITFHNGAGFNAGRAVALYVDSDHAILHKCSIVGHQDTLYARTSRQFYKDCDVYGTVDFIFGTATAVFQTCNLLLRRPKSQNVILANGRNDPGSSSVFLVQNCVITASAEFEAVRRSYKSYLGRPWMRHSRSVVMRSNIGDAVAAAGWLMWPGVDYSKTLYFAEYGNVGEGAGTGGRVRWEGFHKIGDDEADEFTVERLMGGSWIEAAGVPYTAGIGH